GFVMKIKKFSEMRREIDEINDTIEDIEVLMGIEANIVGKDGTIDVPREYLELFDILLAGYHYGARPASVTDIYYLNLVNGIGNLLESWRQKYIEINTYALIEALEKYPIQIITHPGAKMDIDIHRLAKAARKTGTWLEINSKHGNITKEFIEIAKQ